MKYLIEYSEKQGCFHYNYKENTGQFHNEPLSNGYMPITIIDEGQDDEELGRVMDMLLKEKASYEKAARTILFFLL